MRLATSTHRFLFPFTRYIYRHSDAIVTYGDHVKRYLVSEGISAEKIFNTTHAVDNEAYQQVVPLQELLKIKKENNIDPDAKIVLFLGRLEEIKGIEYLLRAFSKLSHPKTILVIAGDGSILESLKNLSKNENIQDRVRFVGYINTENSLPYYAMADVFVLPSVTVPSGKETWGLVVNEAFNQGVPVVATDAVGAAAGGLVEDGVNGFIVPERDPEALAGALRKILDNPDLRAEMSRNARQKIDAWDNEHMVLGFRQAIDYVLEKRKK